MSLSAAEQEYLAGRPRGRLATVAANGAPQNKPVGFRYHADLGTIDIYGFNMESSAKYRNVQARPDVAFLVDDVVTPGSAEGVRFLEIRGQAETVVLDPPPGTGLSPAIIRIHPRRIISWNLEPGRPGLHTRDLTT
jgi:pyridoxamine 5'-phosphate oxidase family protein